MPKLPTLIMATEHDLQPLPDLQVNGFAGALIPQTVTVYIAGPTIFRAGLASLSSVQTGMNVRVVGLLVKDPISGQTVLLAHYVDELS